MPIFAGSIAYAPMPEGWQGTADEFLQQSGQLATIFISGNFLTGFYYPTGTTPPPTLPTSDQGPVVINGQWYFWDPVSGQYLPQTQSVKPARNFCRNAIYQLQQTGPTFTLASGVTNTYDMCLCRATVSNVLAIASDTGPLSSPDTDFCSSSIRYTVGPTLVPTLAATDIFAHEHLIEGVDVSPIRGQTLALSFSVWVNQPGNYSAYITNNGRDMSYVFPFTISTANQWARIKINNVPAFPTSNGTWSFSEGNTGLYLGVVMGVGGQYKTSAPNTWVSGFFAGTTANSNMLTVLNNQMKISGVKFEASATSTYLSVEPFENDYFGCIRYYFTTFNYQSLTAGFPFIMQSQSNNNAFGSMLFERRMAKVPTVVPYGWVSHAAGNVTNISTNADVATATLPSTQKGCGGSIATTGTKGDTFACLFTADARLG